MPARFRVQHLAEKPRGWHVRSKRAGEHVLRIGFPPGPRKRGAGKILEVLHPKANPACEEGSCRPQQNPAELVIFTNPTSLPRERPSPGASRSRRKNSGTQNHKPDCQCPFCKRARGESSNPTSKRRKGRAAARPRRRFANRHMRRNPSDLEQSVKLFEGFHGRDAEKIIEGQRSSAIRLDYAALGPLVALGFDDLGFSDKELGEQGKWEECPYLPFEGNKVMLAAAPAGEANKSRQLYFIDGNQNLDGALEDFSGLDTQKDLIDLGNVFFVVYEARKAHNHFEPTDWCHRFARKTNRFPRLAYDKLKKEMTLIGGAYFIDLSTGLSPGIEG